MLKISLITSLVGFIMFLFSVKRAEVLYKSVNKEVKISKRVPFIILIRIAIMFLIPIVNIFMLVVFTYVFIFAGDGFYKNKVFSELNK